MNTTIQLTMDAELVETLERTTTAQGVALNQVMADLARKYVAEARRKAIAREFEAYKDMHATLVKKYLGEHVAVYEGKLIDHDSDATQLVKRVHEQYGRAPILFVQVEPSPEPELITHSTHIVPPHANPA